MLQWVFVHPNPWKYAHNWTFILKSYQIHVIILFITIDRESSVSLWYLKQQQLTPAVMDSECFQQETAGTGCGFLWYIWCVHVLRLYAQVIISFTLPKSAIIPAYVIIISFTQEPSCKHYVASARVILFSATSAALPCKWYFSNEVGCWVVYLCEMGGKPML